MKLSKKFTPATRYTVTLTHCANCDIGGGYWQPPVDPKNKLVCVSSLEEAQTVFEAWRDRNGLGGGNMARDCGDVRDGEQQGKVIARFSYNGRCWTPFEYGHPEHKEIDVRTGKVMDDRTTLEQRIAKESGIEDSGTMERMFAENPDAAF